jgi:hypothetical protein
MGVIAGVMVLAAAALPATGGLIPVQPHSLTDLLGVGATQATPLETTVMNKDNIVVTVESQAYSNGQGLYAYLYQIRNLGNPSNSPVEMFTLWPFGGASDATGLGYLTGTLPEGFLTDAGRAPKARAYVKALSSGPQVSFYYMLDDELSIGPGEHSVVLYVLSALPPIQITGSIIDGSVSSGPVVGPIPEPTTPEPATLTLLALGGVTALVRRRKR